MKRIFLMVILGVIIFTSCTDEKINTITNTVTDTLVDTQYISNTDSIYDTIIINDTINDTVYVVNYLYGDYTGQYIVIADVSVGGGTTVIDQEIEWRFTNDRYYLYDSTHSICTPEGWYVFDNYTFTLDQINDGTYGAVCNGDYNPQGIFSLRMPGDSVILAQQTNDTLRWIELARK